MASATGKARRRNWYYGWNIVAACVLSQVASIGLPLNAFSLFLHDWSAQLHSPISSLQLAQWTFALVTAGLAPFVGIFADKHPARWLFGAALAAMALFCLAMGSVTATWQILALYGLLLPFAIGFSTSIPSNALVSRWFVRRVGLAMGLTAFGLGLAGVILPPVIAAVMPAVGWRAIWRVGALVIAVVILPAVLLILRDRPTERDGLDYVSGAAVGGYHAHGAAGGDGLRWRDIFRRRNFWLVLAVFLPILSVYQGAAQNLAPIAASRGFSQQTAGALLSLLSLSHLAATLATGLLADRFGNRLPLVGLAIVAAGGAALLAIPSGLPGLGAAVLLLGLGGGVWTLLASAIAVEFGAVGFGRAFGLIAAFAPIGSFTPFLVAKVQESTGSYGPALIALAAITLAGGGVGLLIRERRHGRPTPAETTAIEEQTVTPIL